MTDKEKDTEQAGQQQEEAQTLTDQLFRAAVAEDMNAIDPLNPCPIEETATSRFMHSTFIAAIRTVAGKSSPSNEGFWAMQNLAVLYFFMLHTDIDPRGNTALTEANKKELKDLFAEMRKFLKENPKPKDPDNTDFLKNFIEYRERKEEAAQLLHFVLPARHVIPNNYLANQLQRGDIIAAKRELNLPVLGKGREARNGEGQLITTSVIAAYQPGEGVTIEGNYTEYDRQVQDAVCSLWKSGVYRFTPAMVYRAMTINAAVKPSPQQIGAVTRSIEKQRRIHVQVDASAEFEKRGVIDENGKPIINYKKGRFLLVLTDEEFTLGKDKLNTYTINKNEAPLLLEYSQLTGQLLTVNSELLDIRRIDKNGCICESITNTVGRIALKGYLLRRIEVLRYDIERAKDNFRKYHNRRRKNRSLPAKEVSEFIHQSNRILFDTLFEETGQENTSREVQRRNREYALQCLDYWKVTGRIKGYSIVKGEHNSIRGVDLQI